MCLSIEVGYQFQTLSVSWFLKVLNDAKLILIVGRGRLNVYTTPSL